MKEKHGNVEKMFEPIKEGEKMPDIHFYLNWQCSKCGMKYGKQPEYCCYGHKMVQIKNKQLNQNNNNYLVFLGLNKYKCNINLPLIKF